MPKVRSYSDAELLSAVASSQSWRGVLRALGLKATSASAMRSVRWHADRLGLDYTHFTGQRRWSDADLAEAVSKARSWADVAGQLGLAGGSSHTTLKGHAARLGLATGHLAVVPPPGPDNWWGGCLTPDANQLRRAGSLLAAAWFSLCGLAVSWPLEPEVYDLLVDRGGGIERVQVKTTTLRAGATWLVRLTRSSRSHDAYDPEEIDSFFIIDGDLTFYVIPARVVGGLRSIHVGAYAHYRVGSFR